MAVQLLLKGFCFIFSIKFQSAKLKIKHYEETMQTMQLYFFLNFSISIHGQSLKTYFR